MSSNFQKRYILGIAIFMCMLPWHISAALGNHTGEKNDLLYRVEYLNPLGITTVHENGITYDPFGFSPFTENTILPERYFGSYPLYFAGETVSYRIHVASTGKRTFRNLRVTAAQEYLHTDGGQGVAFSAPLSWNVPELSADSEIILAGNAPIPANGRSGIDQTHLIIEHSDTSKYGDHDDNGKGRVIVDDPQAGLWCPAIR